MLVKRCEVFDGGEIFGCFLFFFCKAGDPTQGFLHSGDNSTNEVSLAEVQIKKNKI